MNSQIPQKPNTFTKESLKKQFRFSEFIAEKIISSVAFLSIATIFLIFIFVFKEAMPLFSTSEKSSTVSVITSDKPESYGDTNEELKPETYGAETVEELKPETYGAESVSNEELKPESYGDTPKEELTVPSADTSMMNAVSKHNDGADKTWSTFLTSEWVPVSENPRFGLIGLLIGTLKVTIIAMLIAGPLAVLAALYTCCFASKRTKEIIKPIIEMLAAFPSVVIGFFCFNGSGQFFSGCIRI
jgi:phosphate transport system permease protein